MIDRSRISDSVSVCYNRYGGGHESDLDFVGFVEDVETRKIRLMLLYDLLLTVASVPRPIKRGALFQSTLNGTICIR